MTQLHRHVVLMFRVLGALVGVFPLLAGCGQETPRAQVDARAAVPDGAAPDLSSATDVGSRDDTAAPPSDVPNANDGASVSDTPPATDGVVADGGPSAVDGPLPMMGGGMWQRLTPVPSVRQEHGVAAVNGQIFLVGGIGGGAARVDSYDPQTNMWTAHVNLPMGVDHPNVAAVGDKLYLLGGTQTGNTFEYNPFAAVADRRWTMKAALPVARAAAAVGVLGTKIFLAGGQGGGVPGAVDLQIYDTVTDTWQASSRGEVPPLPVARNHVPGAVVDGLFFVIGGRMASATSTLYNRVDAYDPVARSWSERPPMPTRRGGVAAGVVAGTIILVGGEGNDRGLNINGVFPQTEAFTPRTNTWTTLAPIMNPRHGMGVVGVGGKLYVPGGGTIQGGGGQSDLFDVLTPF